MQITSQIGNMYKSLNHFVNQTTKSIKTNGKVNESKFSWNLQELGDMFQKGNQLKKFNNETLRLAEYMVNKKQDNLAGIVYSFLVKLNKYNPQVAEKIAQNALAIAKRTNDPIHIAARANDLKEIYKYTQFGSEKHLKVLYDEKRALTKVFNNYDYAKNSYNTLKREIKPKETYHYILGIIQAEIAQVIKKTNPKLALEEALSSYDILCNFGKGKITDKLEKIIAELQAKFE